MRSVAGIFRGSRPRDAVLLECGHGGICIGCAKRVFKKKGRACPMCRQPVSQIVQISPTADEPQQHMGIVRVKQDELPDELAAPPPSR